MPDNGHSPLLDAFLPYLKSIDEDLAQLHQKVEKLGENVQATKEALVRSDANQNMFWTQSWPLWQKQLEALETRIEALETLRTALVELKGVKETLEELKNNTDSRLSSIEKVTSKVVAIWMVGGAVSSLAIPLILKYVFHIL